MCVRLSGAKISPGQLSAFLTRTGNKTGVWGFEKGSKYNARIESIPTVWSHIKDNRGVLTTDSFWEKGKEFVKKDGSSIMIGVIFNKSMEFAVITAPANRVVSPAHHRMPLILETSSIQDFLDGKDPVILGENQICMKDAA